MSDDRRPREYIPQRRRTRNAWKDPIRAIAENLELACRTPCDAAFLVPTYREQLYRWLYTGPSAGPRFVVVVMMPERMRRDAVFLRVLVEILGERLEVARDSLAPTIYAARRLLS